MIRIEFETFRENIDDMKVGGSPNYHQHQFLRLDDMSFRFRNLFVGLKPDQFMVRIKVEPELIEHHDVIPRLLLQMLQHG
jgi:hypothetical protein